jgi:threonine dehydratase
LLQFGTPSRRLGQRFAIATLKARGGLFRPGATLACASEGNHGRAVEPLSAACVQASVRANAPIVVGGPLRTIMDGLRCGEMSPIAFGAIRSIVDGYIAIEDEWARAR